MIQSEPSPSMASVASGEPWWLVFGVLTSRAMAHHWALLVGGGISQLGIQALGCAAYAIWTIVTCWIAWSVIGGLFGGIRVTEKEETEGLDIGEHGMEAYPDFVSSGR